MNQATTSLLYSMAGIGFSCCLLVVLMRIKNRPRH